MTEPVTEQPQPHTEPRVAIHRPCGAATIVDATDRDLIAGGEKRHIRCGTCRLQLPLMEFSWLGATDSPAPGNA